MLPTISKEEAKKSNDYSNLTTRKPTRIYEYFNIKISKSTIDTLCRLDKDERYLYFLKYGILRRFEGEGEVLYVEIPQIPKNLVIYRRPFARNKSSEKLYLNKKDLPHIPLLEGEEYLKFLSLEGNLIVKIDHLISLNNLLFLNLYENKISEIENLSNVPRLKALMLGKNMIEKIKNLNCLQNLEVLDLHSNKIKLIENLGMLRKLRILNLANNQITSFVELMQNKNLEEINLRKNLIVSIPNLTNNFEKIRKVNLGKNMISKIEFLQEFKKLKHLQELFIEDNPVLFLKDSYTKLVPLPIQTKDSEKEKEKTDNKDKSNNVNVDSNLMNNTSSANNNTSNMNNKDKEKKPFGSMSPNSHSDSNHNGSTLNNTNTTNLGKSTNLTANNYFPHGGQQNININYQTSREFRRNLSTKLNNKNQKEFTVNNGQNPPTNTNTYSSNISNSNISNYTNNISSSVISSDTLSNYTSNCSNANSVSTKATTNIRNGNNVNQNGNYNSTNTEDCNANLTDEDRLTLLGKIKYEWELEYRYITENGFNGFNIKKLKETKMQLCHVEIERDKQLNLFGNSIEVLNLSDFYNTIQMIHIEFLNYDVVTLTKNLENLKKFVYLRSINFSFNNIHSYYQLIKLEDLKNLEYVTIKNNEICNSNLLKYFLVYRLQNIKYFNDSEVTTKDIQISKKLFEFFDQAISNYETENEKNKEKKKEENKEKNLNDKNNIIDPNKSIWKNNILDSSESAAIIQRRNIMKIQFFNYIKNNLFTVLDDMTDC